MKKEGLGAFAHMYNTNYEYGNKNVLPHKECKDLLSIGDKINKIDTGNENLNRALRHIAFKLAKQFCPDDIHLRNNMLVIAPCPFHTEKGDQLTFDPYSLRFRCNLSSSLNVDGLIDDDIKNEIEIAKKGDGKKSAEVFKSTEKKDEEESEEEEEESEDFDLDEYLDELGEKLVEEGKFKECRRAGIYLFCFPCPFHTNEKIDSFFLQTEKGIWRCTKDLSLKSEDPDLPKEVRKLAKKAKSRKIESARTEVVERHFLSNHIIISIKVGGHEGYKSYIYNPNKGIYVELSPGEIKTEIQSVYEELWSDKPNINHITEMKSKIYKHTIREEGLRVFDQYRGDYFYVPVKNKDIRINRVTGEIEYLDPDPINRPTLYRLPYDIKPPKSKDPPKIAKDLMKLIPESHHDNFWIMIMSPLLGRSQRVIFYNFSRTGGNGKTTLFNLIEKMYGLDMTDKLTSSQLKERFSLSDLTGKTALLIDDYSAWGLAQNTLKTLASPGDEDGKGGTIKIEKKYENYIRILLMAIIIISSNTLAFDVSDLAFIDRLYIIPWIRKFDPNSEPPKYTDEDIEEFLAWLIHVQLPRYLRNELKLKRIYGTDTIIKWAIQSRKGMNFKTNQIDEEDKLNSPENGIEDFIAEYVYDPGKKDGVPTKIDEVFRMYVRYCESNNILPLADKEFEEEMNKRGLVIEKESKYINLRKKGLELFM